MGKAKGGSLLVRLVSAAGTGFFYVKPKNPKKFTTKLEFRKYDPVVKKHVLFTEAKMKWTWLLYWDPLACNIFWTLKVVPHSHVWFCCFVVWIPFSRLIVRAWKRYLHEYTSGGEPFCLFFWVRYSSRFLCRSLADAEIFWYHELLDRRNLNASDILHADHYLPASSKREKLD